MLALCLSVLPAWACSLCVVSCCVARVCWRRAGNVSLPRAASDALLVSSDVLLQRRLLPVIALGCSGGLPCCARSCRAVSPCVGVCCVRFFAVVFCPVVGCRVVLPARPACAARGFFSCPVSAGCAAPPSPQRFAVPCVVRCRALCRVLLRSVVCFVFCLVPCGVLVSGWALALCCPARCCARSCCASFVLLCCRALLPSLLALFLPCFLPFRGALGCFCLVVLCRAASCCSAWPCFVAFLCWFLLRCADLCSVVPWCGSWFCAVLFVSLRCLGRVLPRPLLWRVVVLCLSLSAVLCRSAVLPVVRRLPFRGAPCAVLCWCACVNTLCAVLSYPCGAGLCFVLLPLVLGCLLFGLAVLCCLLVGPGNSWCRVHALCRGVSLGAVLCPVRARCAARRCVLVRGVVFFCSVWCCCALCWALGRCLSS